MEHERFGSTRFLYKRDIQLFAEIEVVGIDDSLYKFIIHPTKLGASHAVTMASGAFDSFGLSHSHPDVKQTYDGQLECLRAATRLLSTIT